MAEPNATSETPIAKPGNGPTTRKPDVEDRAFAGGGADNLKATLGDAGPVGQPLAPAAQATAPYEIADIWRDAFAPLLSAQMEANRWFDHLWRQTTGMGALPALRPGRAFGALGMAPAFGLPAADLKETDRAYQLAVELPGMSREDIDLKVDRDTIRLSGRKAEEKEEGRGDYRISERRFGSFERTFPIPRDARRDAIQATYADGVLKIVLPKTEQAQGEVSRIEIR
jgi:HSP20 family protein